MSSMALEALVGPAIVSFSRDGVYPENDEVSQADASPDLVARALQDVATARDELMLEIRAISHDHKTDIDAWIENAKLVEKEIRESKKLATEIDQLSQREDEVKDCVKDQQAHSSFLFNEISYNEQVTEGLKGIREIMDLVHEAEEKLNQKEILHGMKYLFDALDKLDESPADTQSRAARVLRGEVEKLSQSLHSELDQFWESAVVFNPDQGALIISKSAQVGDLSLESAIGVMQEYEELNDRVTQFYEQLNETILKPRIDLESDRPTSIEITQNSITRSGIADYTVKSLLSDLTGIIKFLDKQLPTGFAELLSPEMMPGLCKYIVSEWLYSSIPTSLEEDTSNSFQHAVDSVQDFQNMLENLRWDGATQIQDWLSNIPEIWLTKRREIALDLTRTLVSRGIGTPKEVWHVETEEISANEIQEMLNGKDAGADDWDAAWADDDDAPTTSVNAAAADQEQPTTSYEEDDGAAAWGWGDDDIAETEQNGVAAEEPKVSSNRKMSHAPQPQILKEAYTITSIPEGVMKTITTIVEDAVYLMEEQHTNCYSKSAAGLFHLPILVLAMYRATAPYYYGSAPGGNMYLYNDALWLAAQLRELVKQWESREGLDDRTRGKLKLGPDIQAIEKFGRRGYSNEMNTQRTLLTDLLGGAQNIFQHDGQGSEGYLMAIGIVIRRVQDVASEWKSILSKSAWPQAVGSLLGAVTKKLISDVEELPALGADEAYKIAQLISKVGVLDELFFFENENGTKPEVPYTAQYAPDWLKLKFLSEILQSDLKEVQWLWFKSDLSLYFTSTEVIDLIESSFESSPRQRELISKIRADPYPDIEQAEEA